MNAKRLLVIFWLLGSACSVPPADPTPVEGPRGPVPVSRSHRIAGRSREGRPIEVEVLGNGPDTVLFLATIHGDEAAGTLLLDRLRDHLLARPALLAGRRVVLVPIANPDGLAHRTRGNAAGVDLNRNFPTGNYRAGGRHGAKPLSEPESRTLRDLIVRYAPARVVSIHQPLGVIDWDGPGRELAAAMARSSRLRLRKLGARAGSLGSWVGITLGRPIVTLELPGGRGDALSDWARYGPALLLAIRGA